MKLLPNLHNKERYIIHYRNMKLYQSLGMRATKIHRSIKFRQEAWMAPYIHLNTNQPTSKGRIRVRKGVLQVNE